MYAQIVSDSDRFVLRVACCDSTLAARQGCPQGFPSALEAGSLNRWLRVVLRTCCESTAHVDGEDEGMARKFGWVRKLPSGRFQASYISPDGARVNAPTTFTKEEHAD